MYAEHHSSDWAQACWTFRPWLLPKAALGPLMDTWSRAPTTLRHLFPCALSKEEQQWWLPLLLQDNQAKTKQVSISFWFQAALHVIAYCTSHKKKQELSLGSPRNALSWNCCTEDSCTNRYFINKNMMCRATCFAPEPKDKAGCGNCLPPWPRTQNHILSLRNVPLFFPLLPTTDHENGGRPTPAWKGLYTLLWIPCLSKVGFFSSPQLVESQPL